MDDPEKTDPSAQEKPCQKVDQVDMETDSHDNEFKKPESPELRRRSSRAK